MSGNGNFAIDIDEPQGVVEVRYSGTIDLDIRRQAVEAASRALNETGYRRVLVDLSGADMALQGPHEESRFADLLSRTPALARSRTAYLARPEQSVNWFIETLAKVRRYQCEHFTDPAEARGWLAED